MNVALWVLVGIAGAFLCLLMLTISYRIKNPFEIGQRVMYPTSHGPGAGKRYDFGIVVSVSGGRAVILTADDHYEDRMVSELFPAKPMPLKGSS